MRRFRLVLTFGIVTSPLPLRAQEVPREPGAWYAVLSKEFGNPSLRVTVGTGRYGPVIAAIFGDSVGLSRPWTDQQRLAKPIAAFIFAHAGAPPLGVVNIGYELPHFGGANVLRVLRYLPAGAGDTLLDALPPPGESGPPPKTPS